MLTRAAMSAALCALCILTGCGSGSNDGALSGAEIEQTLNAIDGKMATLAGTDPAAFRQDLAAFMRTLPQFASVDVESGGVVGALKGGGRIAIANNRVREPQTRRITVPKPSRDAVGLPRPPRVRLLNGLGDCWINVAPEIKPALESAGYTVTSAPATIENLKSVSDEGVFYISSHGMISDEDYLLWTSTPWNRNTERTYRQEFRDGHLAVMIAADNDGSGGCSKVRHWAVTKRFVTRYMRFGQNSFAYVDACESWALVDAVQGKGASLFAGWTAETRESDAYPATRFLFDRLLGENQFQPQSPPVRPLDWITIGQQMRSLSPPLGVSGDSQLNFQSLDEGRPDGFGLLRPSIASVNVDKPNAKLILAGIFGLEIPHSSDVSVGGVSLTVLQWTPTEIQCRLPASGPGSSGMVEVNVLGHKSNLAGPIGVTVAISPSSISLGANATQGFTATVSGGANQAVAWSVQETGGGTISPSGLYMAPPTPGTYHVIATSQAYAGVSASATVTVTAMQTDLPGTWIGDGQFSGDDFTGTGRVLVVVNDEYFAGIWQVVVDGPSGSGWWRGLNYVGPGGGFPLTLPLQVIRPQLGEPTGGSVTVTLSPDGTLSGSAEYVRPTQINPMLRQTVTFSNLARQ